MTGSEMNGKLIQGAVTYSLAEREEVIAEKNG